MSVVDGMEGTELSSIRGFGETFYGAEISFFCMFYEWMAVLSTLSAPLPTFIDTCTFFLIILFLVYFLYTENSQ